MSDEIDQLEQALKNKYESTLVTLTLRYSNTERVNLRKNYTSVKGHDLLDDIEKYMNNDLKSALLAVYKDPVEYDAFLLYEAIDSDKDVINEIICFRDFDRIAQIKQKFKEIYGKDLISEIKNETSGDYQNVVLYMLENPRNKNSSPDLENCQKIAEDLFNAGENKIGTNEIVFIKYFKSLSPEELQLVSKEYHKNYNRNIVQVIRDELSGNVQKLFLKILYGLYSPSEYFARKIHDSVDGIGTADNQLIRCIVSRSEIDMKMIKRYYKQIYKKDMIQRIKEDTSGEYQRLLEGLMSKS